MANEEQLAILKQGVDVWNKWLAEKNGFSSSSDFIEFPGAKLWEADLVGADLHGADLNEVDLRGANLSGANLWGAHLCGAKLWNAYLIRTNLSGADLSGAHLREADLSSVILLRACLKGADLCKTVLLGEAFLEEADLRDADLRAADIRYAILRGADLSGADLSGVNLEGAILRGASLRGANLAGADLREADLAGADLNNADLTGAILIHTNIDKATVSGSSVYGINVWDLHGEFQEQKDLVIASYGRPVITIDNIKVAQFVHLIMNNEEIRDVINTLTSKSLLILGRFAIAERKAILDALRNKLREYSLLPIVFDFDRPTNRDFTETIKTLAGLSYFVIADITNPKSSPLELQATVPDYQIPFVPIIQEGEKPFAMMFDLQKKYDWVLDTLSYRSVDELMQVLKPAIIDPAIQKHNELRLMKAREPKIRSAEDFIDKS